MTEKLFKHYVNASSFQLKYFKGEPLRRDEEFHDFHEFVFFIRGKARFLSKNIQQDLTEESLIIIPKEHFHQFVISEPEKYERIILSFRETPENTELVSQVMQGIKILDAPNERITYIFERLAEIATDEMPHMPRERFVGAALTELLVYVIKYSDGAITKHVTVSPIVRRAIDYIDKHYTEDISVKSISEHLFVSESTISHKFSREMNISIYQYVLKKRLISAHVRIENGESVLLAASESGFKDYPCFYRLYKKHYK